jgi:hypothetical protein
MPNYDSDYTAGDNGYTNFYTLMVTKQLKKCVYTDIEDYILKGESFPESLSEQKSKHDDVDKISFRTVLEINKEIWKELDKSVDQTQILSDLFETLINEQKKIKTVLPTKNNIESSRAHTCVLIRIGKENNYKYFPLFDMAGTENPTQVNEFFTDGRNVSHMAKLVEKISTVTQDHKIVDSADETKEYPSLGELLTVPDIEKYVNISETAVGGGKTPMKVEEFYNGLNTDLTELNEESSLKFLRKIPNEGAYINHTIGMMIFAAMCVGSSLDTTKSGTVDQFDSFGAGLFRELEKYVCTTGMGVDCSKTRVLLPDINYASILNSSCIWLQVIFSFLYWNRETQESTDNWLKKSKRGGAKYIADMQDYDFVDGVPIKYAKICAGIKMEEFTKVKEGLELVNKNWNNYFASQVSKITCETDKIIIPYEKKKDDDEEEEEEALIDTSAMSEADIQKKIKELEATVKTLNGKSNASKRKKINKQKRALTTRLSVLLSSELTLEQIKSMLKQIETNLNADTNLVSLLKEGFYLELKSSQFNLHTAADADCGSIDTIIQTAKSIPENTSTAQLQTELNQMHRIQDGRIAATKMVLMHLVTGQGVKHFMVKDTIELAKTLYTSTNVDLVKKSTTSAAVVGGDISTTYNMIPPANEHRLHQLSKLPLLPTLTQSAQSAQSAQLSRLPQLPQLPRFQNQ